MGDLAPPFLWLRAIAGPLGEDVVDLRTNARIAIRLAVQADQSLACLHVASGRNFRLPVRREQEFSVVQQITEGIYAVAGLKRKVEKVGSMEKFVSSFAPIFDSLEKSVSGAVIRGPLGQEHSSHLSGHFVEVLEALVSPLVTPRGCIPEEEQLARQFRAIIAKNERRAVELLAGAP